jgi:hypothetical protein
MPMNHSAEDAEDAAFEDVTSMPLHREMEESRRDAADDLLKRKTARAEAEAAVKLKAATSAEPSREARAAVLSEVEVLKAKLAELEGRTAAAPASAPPPVPVAGAAPSTPAKPARPESPVATAAPRERREAPPAAVVCRIEWWRGYMSSEFYATCRDVDGAESIVISSPSFRWRKSTPPPQDFEPAAAAHGTVVAQLEADGWVRERTRGEWYALELRRRAGAAPRRKPKGVG